MRPYRPFALVALLVATVYLAGWFDFIERHLLDLRASLANRPASGELVLITIDPGSLRALERWPWPRRYHAEAIARLTEAGAARIAYDIDFSSASTVLDDEALAKALAGAGAERIALPVFRQLRQTNDYRIEAFDTAPLGLFHQHVSSASINVRPDSDGLVRRIERTAPWVDRFVPTMPIWLLDDPDLAPDQVLLDFSIDPRTLPRISFIDLLSGRFERAAIEGKRVLVGATAIELGDWISVPRHWGVPGPVLQALAFETLVQGRALRQVDGWAVALASALIILLAGPRFARLPWRHGLVVLGGNLVLISGFATALQPLGAIAIETAPPVLGLLLAFSVATLGRVEVQARALVGQVGALPATDDMMRQLVDNTFDAIVTFEARGGILSCNRAAQRIFGLPAPEIVGRPITLLLPDTPSRTLKALAHEGGSRELLAQHAHGQRFPVEATLSRMQVDETWVGIAILRDITQRKAQQAELERMALHDALTGLPNRTLLSDRIAQAISAAKRADATMAVLLLDLDRFKDVNDTLGHQVGDLLLTEVGPRLLQPLRETDTVARLGGDEFAVLLPPPTDLQAACRTAERIVEEMSRPFWIEGLALEVGVSIGVSLYPSHGEAANELLQHADVAMYAAKRSNLGFIVYSPEADTNSVRQLTLTGELRRAIEEDQLTLCFQPKVDAASGTLAGVEALLRWHHPEHGNVPPAEFIHSAEQTGLIRPLTFWVLEGVLRQQEAWRRTGLDLNVAVNLSVKSLQDPELPNLLRQLLERWDTSADRLTLELTESALMVDPQAAMAVLKNIADLGCKLSLDDFGTGYSSLAYLQRLPINELKIDRSFVVAMTEDANAAVIVRSVVKLAKSLGLSVVAEGVEHEAALRRLRALGCDQVQGFLFGAAVSGDRILAWLKANRAGHAAATDRAEALAS